jgi:hypothetical protein
MSDRDLLQRCWEQLRILFADDVPLLVDLRARLAQPLPDYSKAGFGQPQREWQGLTTAETKALWNATKKPSEFAALLQAKLREKNERDA